MKIQLWEKEQNNAIMKVCCMQQKKVKSFERTRSKMIIMYFRN